MPNGLPTSVESGNIDSVSYDLLTPTSCDAGCKAASEYIWFLGSDVPLTAGSFLLPEMILANPVNWQKVGIGVGLGLSLAGKTPEVGLTFKPTQSFVRLLEAVAGARKGASTIPIQSK